MSEPIDPEPQPVIVCVDEVASAIDPATGGPLADAMAELLALGRKPGIMTWPPAWQTPDPLNTAKKG